MILPWTMNKEFFRIEAQQNINDPYLSLDLQQVQGVKGVKERQKVFWDSHLKTLSSYLH